MGAMVAAAITALALSLAWVDNRYVPRELYEDLKHDYTGHLADVACSKALDNYFDAKARVEKYPNDKQAQRDFEQASALKDIACAKIKKAS